MSCRFQIEVDREADGRWIAEIPRLPGVMVYGKTKHDAVHLVRTLALGVLADRIERCKTRHFLLIGCLVLASGIASGQTTPKKSMRPSSVTTAEVERVSKDLAT